MVNNCDTLVCIYTSCEDIDQAKLLKDSLILNDSKFIIFVSRDYSGEEEGVVKLDVKEGYDVLSLKTFKMFEYIKQAGIEFNKLYKIDSTVLSGLTCRHEFEKLDKVKEVFFDQGLEIKSQYFGACPYAATEGSTLAWAKEKGMSIKGGSWWLLTEKDHINYFSGKFYGLGREFFDFLINKSPIDGLSNLMVRDWGGCEDIMIGLIYEKFLKYGK